MTAAADTVRRPTRAARRALLRGTALAACALAGAPLGAQVLPQVNAAGGATIAPDPGDAFNLQVDLKGTSRAVRWNSFNVGTAGDPLPQERVTFLSSTGGANLSVLNRVVAGPGSKIYGAIKADGISVWLVDPAGITFGPTGSFSGGALIVSTAAFADPVAAEAAFLAGTLNQIGIASGAGILFESGSGTISATGAIVAVAQRIDADKPMTSSNGVVALIAASDVLFPAGVGSPLSFEVKAGTNIGALAQVDVTGALSGKSIRIAGGIQDAITANLLNVDPSASLTATDVGGSIILATASVAPDVTITNGVGKAGGIVAGGTIKTTGANADIKVESADALALSGTYAATGNLTFQSAVAISGDATLSATSNSDDDAGGGVLTLKSKADGTGPITLNLASQLFGGTDAQFTAVLVNKVGGAAIQLGAVTGKSLSNIDDATKLSAEAVTVGDVKVAEALKIQSTAGNVKTGALAVTNGSLTVEAFDAALVTGDVATTNDYTVNGKSVTLGKADTTVVQAAAGKVEVTATDGDITGLGLDLGGLTLQSNSDGVGAEALILSATKAVAFDAASTLLGGLAAGPANKQSEIRIKTGTTLTLGAVIADKLADVADATKLSGTIVTVGDVQVNEALKIQSTAGNVKTGAVTVTNGSLTVEAFDAALVKGDVATTKDYTVNGKSVTLGKADTTVVQAAAGKVEVTATDGDITGLGLDLGGLTLQSNSDGVGAEALILSATKAVAFDAASTLLGGLAAGPANKQSEVRIKTGTTLTLGAVIADKLADVADATKLSAEAVTVGDVKVAEALKIQSTAGNVKTGAVTVTNGALTVEAFDAALVTGNVATTKDYTVNGKSVTLGTDGVTVVQSAAGKATVTAEVGDIIGLGPITLQSSNDGDGAEALTLDAAGAVTFDKASALIGGLEDGPATKQSEVRIRTGSSLQLGKVTADKLASIDDATKLTATVVDVGDVKVNEALYVIATTGDLTTGAITVANGDLTLLARNDDKLTGVALTVGALKADKGNVSLQTLFEDAKIAATSISAGSAGFVKTVTVDAAGLATIAGDVAATGDYTVSAAAIALGGAGPVTQRADGKVTMTAATGGITGQPQLTLRANADGVGADAMTLSAAGTDIDLPNLETDGADILISAKRDAILGSVKTALTGTPAAGTIAVLAGDDISIGTASAGEDLAAGAGLTITFTGAAAAGDDVNLTTDAGAIDSKSILSRGDGSDARSVAFDPTKAGAANGIALNAVADGTADVRLSAAGATGDVTTGDLATSQGDIRVSAGRDAAITSAFATKTKDAGGTIAILAATDVMTGALTAREDIAIRGTTGSLGDLIAGDDIDLRFTGALGLSGVTAVADGPDLRAVAFPGPAGLESGISFGPEDPAFAGSNIFISAGGVGGGAGNDVGLVVAKLDGTLEASFTADKGDIRTGTATVTSGNLTATATLGSVSGLSATRIPTNSTAFIQATGDVTLDSKTGTIVLGSVQGASVKGSADSYFLGKVTTTTGALTLTATKTLSIETAIVAGATTLTTTAGAADALDQIGTVLVPNFGEANLAASGNGSLITVSAPAGFAQLGKVTAGLAGGADLAAAPAQIDVSAMALSIDSAITENGALRLLATNGRLALGTGVVRTDADLKKEGLAENELVAINLTTATGLVKVESQTNASLKNVTAATSVTVDATGKATGVSLTAAGGDVTVKAGPLVQFDGLGATGNVFASAGSVLVGSATAGAAITVEAGSDQLTLTKGTAGATATLLKRGPAGQLTLGTLTTGDAIRIESDTNALISSASAAKGDLTVNAKQDVTIGAGTATAGALVIVAGRDATATALTATAEDISLSVAGNATLGTLLAGDNIELNANAVLTVSSAKSTGKGADDRGFTLDLTQAGAAGAINPNRVLASGDVSMTAAIDLRLGLVSSAEGAITGTATAGNITGLAADPGEPLVPNFGRGNLTAQGADKAITLAADKGSIQLAALTAGQGTTTTAGPQIKATAQAIDLTSATTFNGGLELTATTGTLTLATGQAEAGDVKLSAATDLRVGTVTAVAGNITGTATAGNITGLAADPGDPLVPNFGRGNLTAQGADKAITLAADKGSIQLAALTAGQGTTTTAGPQIKATAQAIDLTSATTFNGGLELTATTGTLTLATGQAEAGDVKLSAATDLRVGTVTAVAGNITGTATAGNITGLAADPGDPLVPNFGRGNLTAQGADKTIALTANGGLIQLGSLTAGSGDSRPAGDQIALAALGVNVTKAIAVNGGLTVTATNGPLTLVTGSAGRAASLVKRGATGELALGTLEAGEAILIDSDTSARIGSATSLTKSIIATAKADVTGNPAGGDGADLTASLGDISVTAGGAIKLDAGSAGDDIVLKAVGDAYLVSAITTGKGTDSEPDGSNIRITAASLSGPGISGTVDQGLVLRTLSSGSFNAQAAGGDIRIGDLNAKAGDIAIRADQGSVSGLKTGFEAATGGSTIQAAGGVVLTVGSFAQAGAVAGGVVTIDAASIRLRRIDAAELRLTATGGDLALDNGSVGGLAQFRTQGGVPRAEDPIAAQLAPGYGAGNLNAGQTGALIAVAAPNGVAQLGTLVAGASRTGPAPLTDQIAVTARGVDVENATANNGALALTATVGRLGLGVGEARTTASLLKDLPAGAAGEQPPANALVVRTGVDGGTGVSIRSRTDATVAAATAATGDLTVNASRDLSITAGTAGTGAIALLAGRDLTATTLTASAEDVFASSKANATFNAITAGDNIALNANGVLTLTSATSTSTGADNRGLSLDLSKAGLADAIGAGPNLANGDVALTAGSDLRIGNAATNAGGIAGTATKGGITAFTQGDLTVSAADKAITLTADLGAIQLGALTAGDLAMAANANLVQIKASAVAVDIETATARNGALQLTATDGALGLGTGTARTTATLLKGDVGNDAPANPADILRVRNSVTAGTGVSIRSLSDANVEEAIATTGDLTVNSERDVRVGTGLASTGAIVLLAGNNLAATTLTATAEDIAARAGGNLKATTLTAGDNIALQAGDTLDLTSVESTATGASDDRSFVLDSTKAGQPAGIASGTTAPANGSMFLTAENNVRLGSATTAAGDILATATKGSITGIGAAQTGGFGRADLTASGGNRTISLKATSGSALLGTLKAGQGTAALKSDQVTVQAATVDLTAVTADNGAILLESAGTTEIGSFVKSTGAGLITIRNTGAGATSIGGAANTDFALTGGEVNFLNAANVVIDAKANAITLGALKVDGDTGDKSLRILGTKSVTITGAIAMGSGGAGAGDPSRTLQIGGATSDPITPETKGLAAPATLATEITANTETSRIDFADGIVDLRAQQIVFGRAAFVAMIGDMNNAAVAREVSMAGSKLYNGDLRPAGDQHYFTAKRLVVSYSDYALFQNTAGTVGGGVKLNDFSGANTSALALQLYSTGDDKDNSFALFGRINGFVGRSAGILPNGNLQISEGEGGARLIRITQANSRVNGCVIGSPDKGCLVTDPPRPNFSLYDARQTQLFGATDDASLLFNPLVGRANEGLFVDIADAPVGVQSLDCEPDDPTCKPAEERK